MAAPAMDHNTAMEVSGLVVRDAPLSTPFFRSHRPIGFDADVLHYALVPWLIAQGRKVAGGHDNAEVFLLVARPHDAAGAEGSDDRDVEALVEADTLLLGAHRYGDPARS